MKKSVLLAVTLLLAVSAWIGSGLLVDPKPTSAPGVSADSIENMGSQSVLPPAVQVRILAAAPVSRKLHLMGVTQPKRFVQLRAQTAGAVVVVHSDKGEMLKAGDLVIRIDIRDRKARQRARYRSSHPGTDRHDDQRPDGDVTFTARRESSGSANPGSWHR